MSRILESAQINAFKIDSRQKPDSSYSNSQPNADADAQGLKKRLTSFPISTTKTTGILFLPLPLSPHLRNLRIRKGRGAAEFPH